MTSLIGVVNNRQIRYFSSDRLDQIAFSIPEANWMLFAIADPEQEHLLEHFAKICLDKNVLYVCGAGRAASQLDDAFDWEIVARKIEQNDEDYSDTPMTTWHDNWQEGFWFATTVATHDTVTIDTVFCINLTERDYKSILQELIHKINDGWLPEDQD